MALSRLPRARIVPSGENLQEYTGSPPPLSWQHKDHVFPLTPVLFTHLVDAEHLPGGGAEHDPLAGDGAHHDDLAIRGEAGGLCLLPHIIAPHYSPAEETHMMSDDGL